MKLNIQLAALGISVIWSIFEKDLSEAAAWFLLLRIEYLKLNKKK